MTSASAAWTMFLPAAGTSISWCCTGSRALGQHFLCYQHAVAELRRVLEEGVGPGGTPSFPVNGIGAGKRKSPDQEPAKALEMVPVTRLSEQDSFLCQRAFDYCKPLLPCPEALEKFARPSPSTA